MLSTLGSLGYIFNRSGNSTPAHEPVIVDGVRKGLVEAFIRSVKTHPSFWENLSNLKWVKAVLISSNIPVDHPISQKVDQALEKCRQMGKCFLPTQFTSPNCFHASRMTEMATASKLTAQLPAEPPKFVNRYSQNNSRIEQVKEYIEQNGEQIEEIELTNVNDDLIKLIYEKCPHLTSFKLEMRLSCMLKKFTDEGLGYIAKMPLKTLTLNMWTPESLTQEGLQNLLSQPQLQANLTELSITCGLGNDQIMAPIAQFKQLHRLTIAFPFLTSKGVELLVQSASFKASLQSLELRTEPWTEILVTNNLLQSLTQYNQLIELTLSGNWSADNNTMQKLLQARPILTKLSFTGLAMTSEIASAIGQLTQIQELHLDNCSALGKDDFAALLKNKDSTQTLSLLQTGGLYDEAFQALTKLPNVHSLSLSYCSGLYDGLKTLCESESMQKNLTHLSLSDAPSVTNRAWGQLGQLRALETLSLTNCDRFNDTSLDEILKSSLTRTLKTVDFTNVSISSAMVKRLEEFNQLQDLTLANCYAITQEGTKTLLGLKTLQQRLTQLSLNNAVITPDMVKDFEPFTSLQVLIIGNPNDLGYDHETDFFDLPNIKKNNTQVEVYTGA